MSPEPSHLFGLERLDADLEAVLPPGWLGLLVGTSGTGTHLTAKQFAHEGVARPPVIYYTTRERTPDVEKAFREFGWDPKGIQIGNLEDEYFARVLQRELAVSRARERGLTLAELQNGSANRLEPRGFNLGSRILADLADIEGRFRLVLDSLDFFVEVMEPGEVVALARQIRHRAQTLGGESLIVLQPEVLDRRTLALLYDLADLIVEIQAEALGQPRPHRLVVRKVRNHPEKMQVVSCLVTERGLALAPT